MRLAWIALVFVLTAIVMVAPAHAVVTELVGDRDDMTYSIDTPITLKGDSTVGAGKSIQLIITNPDGDEIHCASLPGYCATTTTKSGGVMTFTPIPVDKAFKKTGTYMFSAYELTEGEGTAYTILINYADSIATILGPRLEIESIDEQSANAGKRHEFNVTPTNKSDHTDIQYLLKEPSPPAAQITDDGMVIWTPSDGDIHPRPHKITVEVQASSQTAEITVDVTVGPREQVSMVGVTELNPDRMEYVPGTMMTLSGGTTDVDTNTMIKLLITPQSGGDSTALQHTPVKADNMFSFEPVSIDTAFPSDGDYTVKVSTPDSDLEYVATIKRAGTRITYEGVALELMDIQEQWAFVGSQISFTVSPTYSDFTDIKYELTGDPPSGAKIAADDGEFTWTPSSSDLGSDNAKKVHTITISANSESEGKSTTKDVVINVRRVSDGTGTSGTGSDTGSSDTTPAKPSSVTSITTDKASYSHRESIIFSGTTVDATRQDLIAITITPTATTGTVGTSVTRSALPKDDNTFASAPFPVKDMFSRAGKYTINAYISGPQDPQDGATLNMEYENRIARVIFDTPLKIVAIERQSVVAGSALQFTAEPTSSSFKDLEWSIGGPPVLGASINSDGLFRWETSESMMAPISYTITITATDGLQTDSIPVSIDIREPVIAEPEPEPEPDPEPAPTPSVSQDPEPDPLDAKRDQFLATVTEGTDPESLVERYESEPGYKAWFDGNFEGLDIREALGIGEMPAGTAVNQGPDPRFVSSMTDGDDPQIYIDRYNSDPAYKAWFDRHFADLTIEEAAGLGTATPPPTTPATLERVKIDPDPSFAPYMTDGDDPQTYIDRYNSEPSYKTWFDQNFAGLTIEEAAGLGTTAPPSATPVPPPAPSAPAPPEYVEVDPDPRFVPLMTDGDDPQTYIDRYNSDPTYKAWFDQNFADLTIQEAAGLDIGTPPPPEPDPKFVPFMIDGDDPQIYIDRYNSDPGYKAWFDQSFPGLSIQDATGYVKPSTVACPPGTVLQNNKCAEATTRPVSGIGGCLVATATYGTEMAPQVQSLREVRDSVLLTTGSGSAFMTAFNDIYYTFSPTVADIERQSPEFRSVVRALITPMISSLSVMSLAEQGSESDVLALGIAVIALNIGLYVGVPIAAVHIVRTRL